MCRRRAVPRRRLSFLLKDVILHKESPKTVARIQFWKDNIYHCPIWHKLLSRLLFFVILSRGGWEAEFWIHQILDWRISMNAVCCVCLPTVARLSEVGVFKPRRIMDSQSVCLVVIHQRTRNRTINYVVDSASWLRREYSQPRVVPRHALRLYWNNGTLYLVPFGFYHVHALYPLFASLWLRNQFIYWGLFIIISTGWMVVQARS